MQLTAEDSQKLEDCLRGGVQRVRTVRRALVLQQLARGRPSQEIAVYVGVGVNTVYRVEQRYEDGGLQRALYDKPRPGAEPRMNDRQRQEVVALVCGPPPQGRARWTVRLITAEAVKRGIVASVGRETIRLLLQNHDLQPWREKNVVRAGLGSALCGVHGKCSGHV